MSPAVVSLQSHPTWVRGLKLMLSFTSWWLISVAPYVGAWIETYLVIIIIKVHLVAPYVGAWIETRLRNV